MRKTSIILAVLALVCAPVASAGRIHLSWISQQYGASSAAAGAEIVVNAQQASKRNHRTHATATATARVSGLTGSGSVADATTVAPPPPVYPPLPASSLSLKQTHPRGPTTFWYLDGSGHLCVYVPESAAVCYTITAAASAAAAVTPTSPASLAARVADRFSLTAGQVKASPSEAGLTGALSWFWLDPPPTKEQRSISLGGEAVTVTAVPQIEWGFGDGVTTDGGAGVPYQPGTTPADAITHSYDTRCLPGDQGRDPYVLASCGSDGYQLTATVTWQIGYQAAGPITESGTLPTRTTTSSAAYPVSEVRAFLIGGTEG